MPDWLNYKGIEVPDATPTGAGGLRLKDDLTALADRAPNLSSSDPSATDDSGDGYFPGSLWLNTSTQTMWVCVDATVRSAVWKSTYQRDSTQLILVPEADGTVALGDNLDVNGNGIVSIANGDIPITPNGTGQILLDGLDWPTADGVANQLLQTDGAGHLSFGFKHNATGSSPGTSNDISQGYEEGSSWINTSSDLGYVCLDKTASSAVWRNSTPRVDSSIPSGGSSSGLFRGAIWIYTTDELAYACVNDASSGTWRNITPRVASSVPSGGSSLGYFRGAVWINTTSDLAYACVNDASSGTWRNITPKVTSSAPSGGSSSGYFRGAVWINTTDDLAYACVNDASSGTWRNITPKVTSSAPSGGSSSGYFRGAVWINTTDDLAYA